MMVENLSGALRCTAVSPPPVHPQTPKIMITTRPRPSGNLFHFVQDLLRMIPNAFFYPRSEYVIRLVVRLVDW